jgi:hypothetical protein
MTCNGKKENGNLNTPKLAKQVPPLFNQKGNYDYDYDNDYDYDK